LGHYNFIKCGQKKYFWGPGPSSFGRQQRLSEITIEPIKNLGAGEDLGAQPPCLSLNPPLRGRLLEVLPYVIMPAKCAAIWRIEIKHRAYVLSSAL